MNNKSKNLMTQKLDKLSHKHRVENICPFLINFRKFLECFRLSLLLIDGTDDFL